MAERTSPEFRFDAHDQEQDQEPDEFYKEEIKDLRVEKLSQRITIISILLPCLMAVAIYFGYRDLTGRVHQDRDSGNLEVQKLSSQLEDLSKQFNEKLIMFSTTLSAQDQDFGNSISAKLNTINKNIETLNRNYKSLNDALEQTKSNLEKLNASKADKKDQENAISKINTELTPLKKELQALAESRQDIKSVSSEIKNIESRFTKELALIAANTDKFAKDHDLLQASIDKQLNEKIDKTALSVELLMFKKNQSLQSQEITELNRKLDSIQKQIENIRTISKSIQPPMESIPSKIPPAKSTAAEKISPNDHAIPSNSEDIKVQEQDLPPE